MFQYEYEKRSPSASSSCGRATTSWGQPPPQPARPPLPPRPRACHRMPTKTTVPLKVWVVASASCFAVCAALVLATVAITRWGSAEYTAQLMEAPGPVYPNPHPIYITSKPHTESETTTTSNFDDDMEIIEKLSIFKNIVASRQAKTKDLVSKPQLHPAHDTTVEHANRNIAKKDQAIYPEHADIVKFNIDNTKKHIPAFKPTLPDVFVHGEVKLPDGYLLGLKKPTADYEEYYSDDNLYDDYLQSNTMTNYLIEKVQELHDWINSDPDFEVAKNSSRIARNNDFSQILQSLNQSLVQGNASIVLNKLKDIYFGENYTSSGHGKKIITSNSTDLLSFGILTLDIMLLHNIQLMAWENQEAIRVKMLQDPDVFAFNALFMEPSKLEARLNEISRHDAPLPHSKRPSHRQDVDEFDIGKSLLDNFLEIGVSTTRAAVHLGRAYKNTKSLLNQLSNLESPAKSAPRPAPCTALDCVWLLYCRNLAVTAQLGAPYGSMARVNGLALRMLTGELSVDKALETMVFESLSGWKELRCNDMFPRCSEVNVASVVMETVLQPSRKS